jgi:formate-dependent nitrite reductase cytochrome c552 subunit
MSWVIREKATGKAIAEVWQQSVAAKVNAAKYEAVPIQEHLASINRALRTAQARASFLIARGAA